MSPERSERSASDANRPRPPVALREGIRDGVLAALGQSGAHAARRLLAAGAAGVAASVGAVLLLAGDPFGQRSSWQVAIFSCLWGALFVVAFALVWFRIRTLDWPLADAARAAIAALGLAGVASLFSSDPHIVHAWLASDFGHRLTQLAGTFASAFGLALAVGFPLGLASAASTLRGLPRRDERLALVATAMVVLLLLPGIALQCVDAPLSCFLGCLLGTPIGSGLGIAVGLLPLRGAPSPAHE